MLCLQVEDFNIYTVAAIVSKTHFFLRLSLSLFLLHSLGDKPNCNDQGELHFRILHEIATASEIKSLENWRFNFPRRASFLQTPEEKDCFYKAFFIFYCLFYHHIWHIMNIHKSNCAVNESVIFTEWLYLDGYCLCGTKEGPPLVVLSRSAILGLLKSVLKCLYNFLSALLNICLHIWTVYIYIRFHIFTDRQVDRSRKRGRNTKSNRWIYSYRKTDK